MCVCVCVCTTIPVWTLTEERQSNEQKDTVILLHRQVHEREHYIYLNRDISL